MSLFVVVVIVFIVVTIKQKLNRTVIIKHFRLILFCGVTLFLEVNALALGLYSPSTICCRCVGQRDCLHEYI